MNIVYIFTCRRLINVTALNKCIIHIIIFFLFVGVSDGLKAQVFVDKQKPKTEVQISIFPNPTSDFFTFKNDREVKTVAVYNIIGKEIKRYSHTVGQSYSVDDLQKGIYIVRLFDRSNKVFKVFRLNRN